jgi:hypothetical protein
MVCHEYAKRCIHTLDIYKMLVHRYPVFVRLFLFQILFLYSFSRLLLFVLLVWLFSAWFLGFLGTSTYNQLLNTVSLNMPVSIHDLEVPFRHRILFCFIIGLIGFDVNDWCAIKQVDSSD